MVALTADDTRLLKDVGLFIEPVEVYDARGKLLGLFVPANLERLKEIDAQLVKQIDWDEIENRRPSNEEGAAFETVQERLKLLQEEVERRETAGEGELTADEAVEFIDRLRNRTVFQCWNPDATCPDQ